jgi:hypothetical protein
MSPTRRTTILVLMALSVVLACISATLTISANLPAGETAGKLGLIASTLIFPLIISFRALRAKPTQTLLKGITQ